MASFQTVQLSSGAQLSTRSTESIYGKYGMRALENGAMIMDFSEPVADYQPPVKVDLHSTFPNGTVMEDGQANPSGLGSS